MHREPPHRALVPARLFRKSFLAGCVVALGAALEPTAQAQYNYPHSVQEPKIIEQPQSQTVEQGQTATFKVKLEPLKDGHTYSTYWDDDQRPVFQWVKNGARIIGATTDTLTFTNVHRPTLVRIRLSSTTSMSPKPPRSP